MELIEKTVVVKCIKNEYGEFEVHDLLDILQELEDTDSFGNRLSLDNSKMEKWFKDINLIEKSVRGSVYLKDEKVRKDIFSEVYKLIYGEYPEEDNF